MELSDAERLLVSEAMSLLSRGGPGSVPSQQGPQGPPSFPLDDVRSETHSMVGAGWSTILDPPLEQTKCVMHAQRRRTSSQRASMGASSPQCPSTIAQEPPVALLESPDPHARLPAQAGAPPHGYEQPTARRTGSQGGGWAPSQGPMKELLDEILTEEQASTAGSARGPSLHQPWCIGGHAACLGQPVLLRGPRARGCLLDG